MGAVTFQKTTILGLYTETPLHCGAESGVGYIDLPIQRERHTQFPVIPGSTLKGVLRDEAKSRKPADVVRLFGAEDATTSGSLAFTDGFLVAFPVRSSYAPFHWVTCPFVLERVFRALGETWMETGSPDRGAQCWSASANGEEVLLEELVLSRVARGDLLGGAKSAPLQKLLELLPGASSGFAYTSQEFLKRLLVLHDDDFTELVKTTTEVVTRIKLNYLGTTAKLDKVKENKRREAEGLEERDFAKADLEGNLFVEELVPPETLFVSTVRVAQGEKSSPSEILPPVVRLGGDETIGRGVTHVTLKDITPKPNGTQPEAKAEVKNLVRLKDIAPKSGGVAPKPTE